MRLPHLVCMMALIATPGAVTAQTRGEAPLETKTTVESAILLEVLVIPYIARTGLSENQGFISVDNYAPVDLEVNLDVYDDFGTHVSEVLIEIPAESVEWFNSEHLEKGHPDRGLTVTPQEAARGPTLWATVTSQRGLDIFAYSRIRGVAVVPMGRIARHERMEDGRWKAFLPFFNPGSAQRIRSILRVVNPSDQERTIWLTAWDLDYMEGAATITCIVPAMSALDLSARSLEEEPLDANLDEGGCTGDGWGDGRGKWWVRVADANPREDRLIVMGLTLSDSTGLVTNVSQPELALIGYTTEEGIIDPDEPTDTDFAPADPAAFWAALDGNLMSLNVTSSGTLATLRFTRFGGLGHDGRLTISGFPGGSRSATWNYTKRATPHRAQLDFWISPGALGSVFGTCYIDLVFDSETAGRFSSTCTSARLAGYMEGQGTFAIGSLF